MDDDDILRQVRQAREAYAEAHGFDIGAMIADLQSQNARGDWPVVRLSPRRPVGYGVSGVVPELEPPVEQAPFVGDTSSASD